jgi:hypothetical protein
VLGVAWAVDYKNCSSRVDDVVKNVCMCDLSSGDRTLSIAAG